MKKLIVMLIAVLMIFALVACNAAPSEADTGESTEGTEQETAADSDMAEEAEATGGLVGISVPGATHGWVAATAYFSEKTAKELGLDYKLVVSANPVEQANQLTELVDMGW